VPYLPDSGFGFTDDLLFLQSGGIQRYYKDWSWFFGELPPGRYLFLRDNYAVYDGHQLSLDKEFVMVEFSIEWDSPTALPPPAAPSPYLALAGLRDISPSGVTVVLENISEFDFTLYAYVGSIIYGMTWLSPSWDFSWPDFGGQELEVFKSGSSREFNLDWSAAYGELSPGQYSIYVFSDVTALPPHPVGRFHETLEFVVTIE
jgi:hypothetical protein